METVLVFKLNVYRPINLKKFEISPSMRNSDKSAGAKRRKRKTVTRLRTTFQAEDRGSRIKDEFGDYPNVNVFRTVPLKNFQSDTSTPTNVPTGESCDGMDFSHHGFINEEGYNPTRRKEQTVIPRVNRDKNSKGDVCHENSKIGCGIQVDVQNTEDYSTDDDVFISDTEPNDLSLEQNANSFYKDFKVLREIHSLQDPSSNKQVPFLARHFSKK